MNANLGTAAKIAENFKRPIEEIDVASSNFLSQYEIENCVFCKKCTELCPMYTIKLVDEDNENKRIEINTDRCIGCGVCAFNCKSEAITMVKNFTKIPVENMREAAIRNIKGRIK